MILVFLNGALLIPGRDWTTINEDTLEPRLEIGATSGSEVHVVRAGSIEPNYPDAERFFRVVPPNSDPQDYAHAHAQFSPSRRPLPMFTLVAFEVG